MKQVTVIQFNRLWNTNKTKHAFRSFPFDESNCWMHDGNLVGEGLNEVGESLLVLCKCCFRIVNVIICPSCPPPTPTSRDWIQIQLSHMLVNDWWRQ